MVVNRGQHRVIARPNAKRKLAFFSRLCYNFFPAMEHRNLIHLFNIGLKATPLNRNYQAAPKRGTLI